jgi:RNA polymerase sigma factor (sigma-70 family)
MANGSSACVLHYLHRARAPRDVPGVSDAELLERFLNRRDDAAFELLVWRHGKMVLGVCRRVLRDEHDAEDAFQAAFLVLARRAGSIRARQSVGGWLYRVAYRVALDLRTAAARRTARERPLVEAATPAREPPAEAAGREVLRLIEAELDRLPEKYRVPFVRCCAGESSTAIARDLGCPPGTVESWLTRARQRLRAALVRRGVVAPAGMLAGVLAGQGAARAVPSRLVARTVRGVAAGPGGAVPARVAALAEAAVRATGAARWKVVAAVLLLAATVGGGAALVSSGVPADPERRQAAEGAGPAADAAKPGPGRIFVHVIFPPTLVDVLAGRDLHAKLLAIDPVTGTWDRVAEAGGFPRLSPDGHTLLFTMSDGTVRSCDLRGRGEAKRLCEQRGRPVWSPDGKRFVITREEARATGPGAWQDETWRYNADGSGATKLPVPDTDAVQDWSPDGKWFVTVSDRHPPFGQGYQLYVMHPDGTGQRRLTKDGGLNCYARFSPDGARIVYLHQQRGVNSLHVMDLEGGKDREVLNEKDRLTPDSACWSPDGKRLAVVLVRRAKPGATDLLGSPILDTYRLEIMDADGGNRREIKLRLSDDVPLIPRLIGLPDWRSGTSPPEDPPEKGHADLSDPLRGGSRHPGRSLRGPVRHPGAAGLMRPSGSDTSSARRRWGRLAQAAPQRQRERPAGGGGRPGGDHRPDGKAAVPVLSGAA